MAGKSTLINQVLVDWLQNQPDQTIGILSLEADKGQLGENLLGTYIGTKLQLLDTKEKRLEYLQSDAVREAATKLFTHEDGTPTFYMIDDRGDFTGIEEKVEKLIITKDVKVVIIDVLSDIFDTLSISEQQVFMGWQKNICKRYGTIFFNIMHIRKSSGGGKSASEGAAINDDSLAGSSTVVKSSSLVIALRRNKMEEDEVLRNVILLDVLKCRDTGITGNIMQLYYSTTEGRLSDFTESYAQYKEEGKADTRSKEEKEEALNRF